MDTEGNWTQALSEGQVDVGVRLADDFAAFAGRGGCAAAIRANAGDAWFRPFRDILILDF